MYRQTISSHCFLVATAFDLLISILLFRNTNMSRLVSELGGYIAGHAHASASTERMVAANRQEPLAGQEVGDHPAGGVLGAKGQLSTRLIFGMYPDVVTNLGNEREILAQLSGSYLYKDLLSLKGIRRPNVLEKLLRALAFQIGNEVSFNELSRLVEIDKVTVETYIRLLEQAFVVFRLQPFSRNLRNEINTSRKIYFYDNGIRNALIESYAPLELRNDVGALWENFLVSERMKRNHYTKHYAKPYFWRTHAQQEIDYLEESDGQLSAYEFKWSPKAKARFPKTFSEAYSDAQKRVINPENFVEFLLS